MVGNGWDAVQALQQISYNLVWQPTATSAALMKLEEQLAEILARH
jgi:hypothetical protein